VNLVDNTQPAPATLTSEIEAALRSLAGKLQSWIYEHDRYSPEGASGDNVLLDVEFDEIRMLVLRRSSPSPMSLLSPREQEIARMVAQGHANKTIASVLEISSWTVASHLRRIFVKLRVSSRAAMVSCLLGKEFEKVPSLPEEVVPGGLAFSPMSLRAESASHTTHPSADLLLSRS
jgi:DNA-binding CsgD family transcriptional regulator